MAPKAKRDDSTILDQLASEGWNMEAEAGYVPRVTLDIVGLENQGKTGLALSVSSLGPVAYMAFDPGWEIVEKFRKMGRKVAVKRYSTRIPDGVDPGDWPGVAEAMMPELERWTGDLARAAEIGVVAAVIDTASEAYELVRLALMGRLNPNITDDYGRAQGQVNAAMRSILKRIEDSGMHLITLHKISEFTKDGGATTTRVNGWKDISYYAPYRVRARYDFKDPDTDAFDAPKFFQAEILKSKFVPDLQGRRVMVSQEDGFEQLAEMMVPHWPAREGKATAAPVKKSIFGRKK